VEGWLADAIAERFSRAENAAFVRGDGVDKPRGFLNYAIAPVATAGWGAIGYHPTGAAGGFGGADPANAIIDLVYSLGAKYRANATFVMNSKTAGSVRKMKDADGRFIWAEPSSREQPAILMGYPVLTCEEMPDIAPDTTAVAFGDFRAGYTIAERPDLRILRDPYSAKPHVQFYSAMRVGGDVTDFSAIRLLKFGVA
jgi:HK97 family phage major capsid protein